MKQAIYEEIRRSPGITADEIADYYNVSREQVSFHLLDLLQERRIRYTYHVAIKPTSERKGLSIATYEVVNED